MSISPHLIASCVLLAAILAIALVGGAPGNAGAPVSPSTTADEYDGVCDAHCSLRDAITAINAGVSLGTTVELESGATYTLTIEDIIGVDEDLNETGDLDVTTTILIRSSGPDPATIEAETGERVIEVREPVAQGEGRGTARLAGSAAIILRLEGVVITVASLMGRQAAELTWGRTPR